MERDIAEDKIILLFDRYTLESQYLYESVEKAGYDCIAIVIGENDFLPKEVFSIYDLLLGYFDESVEIVWEPRFFNEIGVPDTWSISAGVDEPHGKISYLHEEKGRIYYLESEKKYLVKSVEWLDRKGHVFVCDHYNRFGRICARTFYGAEQQPLSKSWFSAEGKEIIVENYITGDIIFNNENIVKLFRTRLDLICYCFKDMGLEKNRFFINSLAEPYFILNRLATMSRNLLFWQESVREEIPINMQEILYGSGRSMDKVVIQKRRPYDKLLELGANEKKVYKLGFIYPFEKENQYRTEALICTDSDKIEHCQEMIEAFPQMHFHIAAITVMSPKLLELDTYDNVSLYPAVKAHVLKELFMKCDYYFDINYYAEVNLAVHKAFIHNQLIFVFRETVHNQEDVAEEHIYPIAEFEKMRIDIKKIMGDEKIMKEHLQKQQRAALAENVNSYKEILDM